MNIQPIGKGHFRIKIRDKRRRQRLARIPGVQVFLDGRIVFNIENLGNVLLIVVPRKRKR